MYLYLTKKNINTNIVLLDPYTIILSKQDNILNHLIPRKIKKYMQATGDTHSSKWE